MAFFSSSIADSMAFLSAIGSFVARVLDHPLRRRRAPGRRGSCFDLLAPLLVFFGVGLGVPHHPLDLVLAQAGRRRDRDLLFLLRAQVLGGDVDDAVGVDVEGHFDLRHTARRRRNADEVESSERPVVARERPLALQHVHLDARLVVGRRRENSLFRVGMVVFR